MNNSSHGSETFRRYLSVSYLVAVSLIALVVTISEVLIQQDFEEQEAATQITNLAGRQRMLSQRITKDLLLIERADSLQQRQSAMTDFRHSASQFIATHMQLTDDKSSDNLTTHDSPVIREYQVQLAEIFPSLQQALNSIMSTADVSEPLSMNSDLQQHIQLVLDIEIEFLELMDKIVFQYVKEAEARITQVERISFYLYICVIAALILTILVIFYPMTQKVSSLFQKLLEKEKAIRKTNHQLEKTLAELNDTQAVLLDTEKKAILAGTVAGIAHDVNTPLGICLTAITHLQLKWEEFNANYEQGEIKRTTLEKYLEGEKEGNDIIKGNLERALELISNFKQIAIDQSTEDRRLIDLKEYLQQILKSLHPRLRKTKHNINIVCPEGLRVNSSPSVFYQIFTNLIMNSLIHGFTKKESGQILIEVSVVDNNINIVYKDDGVGVSHDVRAKIFDPFYTTNRKNGGSGLGAHIIHCMVTQELNGTITCESVQGQGITFIICFPIPPSDR